MIEGDSLSGQIQKHLNKSIIYLKFQKETGDQTFKSPHPLHTQTVSPPT